MEYRIYVLSSKTSQLPYDVEGVLNDKSKDIIWKFIGQVDDLEIAREMIIKDKVYLKKNDKEYLLDFNPSGDLRFDFVKIEYDDNVEYYDYYCNSYNTMFGKRRKINDRKENSFIADCRKFLWFR